MSYSCFVKKKKIEKKKEDEDEDILPSLSFCIAINVEDADLNVLSQNGINPFSAFIWLIAHHTFK